MLYKKQTIFGFSNKFVFFYIGLKQNILFSKKTKNRCFKISFKQTHRVFKVFGDLVCVCFWTSCFHVFVFCGNMVLFLVKLRLAGVKVS